MTEQFKEVSAENFSQGLLGVEIPGLGPKIEGKVRDIWVVGDYRIMITTDRQSAFDRLICTVPGKGQALNLISAWWFERTKQIFPNHLIAIPHPNVLIAQQVEKAIGVEVVFRRYMARSSTRTSVYYNYTQLGRRRIHGVDFPDGLYANCEFPMGTILTPTTKAETDHDLELTDEEAAEIADRDGIPGTWDKIKTKGREFFDFVYNYFLIGLDSYGNLMVIDEIFTPDSSRIWLAETYRERFEAGVDPEAYDKEILRRWLAAAGFTGDGIVPKVPMEIINQMSSAYKRQYEIVTRKRLPSKDGDPSEIAKSILSYLS